jgi:predicted GH43/DUF377 family glycosyl hydrolase
VINNLVRKVLENNGDIYPLVIDSEFKTGLLNPGLYLHNDDLYINVRHVQYVLYHSENNQFFQSKWGPLAYLHPEHDQTLTTVNYFGEFKNGVLDVSKVNTSKLDVKPLWEFVGLEDVRVVVWDDKIWMCGVRRDTTTNGQGRMEMSNIVWEDNEWREVERYRLDTPFSNNSYCEKNWVPINDKPYHFLKWTNPVEVVKVNLSKKLDNQHYKCEQVFLGDTVLNLPRDIRGGSNLVNFGDNYLMVTHEVNLFKSELKNKDAFYYHRFFLLDKDFKVIKISDDFNFLTGNIEFATGLVVKDNEVYISFGFQDNSAFLLKTSTEFIDKLLVDVKK